MKSSYVKGRRREYRTTRLLEARGYRVVRAAGSHSEWDLVAFGAADVRLIQVKSNVWPGPAEREGMEVFPMPDLISPRLLRREIWRWDDRAKEPRIKELTHGRWLERVGMEHEPDGIPILGTVQPDGRVEFAGECAECGESVTEALEHPCRWRTV